MRRVDLAEHVWAVFRDPTEVSTRLRRKVRDAYVRCDSYGCFVTDQVTPTQRDALENLSDLSVIALVDSWSFSASVDVDTLMDLPAPVGDWLARECAEHAPALIPELGVLAELAEPVKKVPSVRSKARHKAD